MAKFQRGDNWDAADLVLITTNATINERGGLVMGAGIARQARDRFCGLDKALAQQIKAQAQASTPFEYKGRRYRVLAPPYHLLVSPRWPERKLGIFQVKMRFYLPASLDLVAESTRELLLWCAQHPGATVHLNFPGIGNGRLRRGDVLPVVEALPDDVIIWEL